MARDCGSSEESSGLIGCLWLVLQPGLLAPGLFDELIQIIQSARAMRLFGILLVAGGVVCAAPAQTNNSAQMRQLSLQDCIQEALLHNLDVQIDRYGPKVALFTL